MSDEFTNTHGGTAGEIASSIVRVALTFHCETMPETNKFGVVEESFKDASNFFIRTNGHRNNECHVFI